MVLRIPRDLGTKLTQEIVGVTITPESGQSKTNPEVGCCCIYATKQKCAEINNSSLPLTSRMMANFLCQNSKKKRDPLNYYYYY